MKKFQKILDDFRKILDGKFSNQVNISHHLKILLDPWYALLLAECVCRRADGGYWVGKASLRSWKRLALEQIHQVAAPSAASDDVATAGSPESSDGVAHDDRQAAAPTATASLVNRQVASSAEGPPTVVRCKGNANTDARSSSENTKRAPASETKTGSLCFIVLHVDAVNCDWW